MEKMDKKIKRTVSRGSLKYSMMLLLYFLNEIRKDDLYTFGTHIRTARAVSACYANLLDEGFITEEPFVTSNHRNRYTVTKLTKKGKKEFLNINYAYNDLYYENHANDFETKASDAFNSYASLGRSKDGQNIADREKLHVRSRAIVMMYASQIAVLPDEKPMLADLISALNKKGNNIKKEDSFYMTDNKETYQAVLENGIYYTKGEFLQYLNQLRYDGADQIYASRFAGVLVNDKRCIIVYVVNPRNADMIRLIQTAERTAINLVRREMQKISKFNRELNVLGEKYGDVEATVITNGDSLVYTMTTGRHVGKDRFNASGYKPKLNEKKENIELENKTELDEEYRTVNLILPKPVDGLNMASELRSRLEDIPTVQRAIVDSGNNEFSILLSNEASYPKEAIVNCVKMFGFDSVMRKKQIVTGTLLNAETSLYAKLYAVTADQKGLKELEYLMQCDQETQIKQANKLVAKPIQNLENIRKEITQPNEIYPGRIMMHVKPLGENESKEEVVKIGYMPVLELKQLRDMSLEGSQQDDTFVIIANKEYQDLISKCVRKKIYYLNYEAEKDVLVLSENEKEYGYNGMPYGTVQSKKYKQRERRHTVTFEIPITLHTQIKHLAEANGIYSSTMMRNMLEAVMYSIGNERQNNLNTSESIIKEICKSK